jgi:MoaA/NifB/PqqE/SkfB family radical SAM enzyme
VTWHTEYQRTGAAAIQDRQPYLAALLQTSERDVGLARSRVRNWLQARTAERARPDVVDGMPYHVVLDPATICNLRCPLCVQATDPRGRKRGLVDVARYRDLIQQLTPHAIKLDLFNWGEPLLHPGFHQLVQIADAASIWTRTSSNLSIRTGFVPERIVDAGLRYLVVSIDGATQVGYEQYRIRGDLGVVLANVAALIKARDRSGAVWPLVEWQFLALRANVHELDGARRLARDLGVDVFRYGGARGRMSSKLRLSTPANFAQSADLLLEPSHPLSEYEPSGAKRRSSERDGCRWLWGKAVLNPDGGVAPCVSSWFGRDDLGTWDDGGFRSVWNGPAYMRARMLARTGGDPHGPSICAQCAHHRNFVPTPDLDDEPLPTPTALGGLAAALTDAGVKVSAAVHSALEQELSSAAA